MVSKKGVFSRLNFSIPTDNFHYVMNEISRFHYWVPNLIFSTFSWLGQGARLNYILTEEGICYGFNYPPSSELIDEDLVTSDFFYTTFGHFYQVIDFGKKLPRRVNVPEPGFHIDIAANLAWYDKFYGKDKDGYNFYIHNAYELPTRETSKVFIDKNSIMNILIEPQLNDIDESMVDFEPER